MIIFEITQSSCEGAYAVLILRCRRRQVLAPGVIQTNYVDFFRQLVLLHCLERRINTHVLVGFHLQATCPMTPRPQGDKTPQLYDPKFYLPAPLSLPSPTSNLHSLSKCHVSSSRVGVCGFNWSTWNAGHTRSPTQATPDNSREAVYALRAHLQAYRASRTSHPDS
jgi:hypothetical protein